MSRAFAREVREAERRGRSATIPYYALNRNRALELAARIRRQHPAQHSRYPEWIAPLRVTIQPPAIMHWTNPAKLTWCVRVDGRMSECEFHSAEEWDVYSVRVQRFAAGRRSLLWNFLRDVQLDLQRRCEQQPHSSYFVEPIEPVIAARAA